MVTTLEANGQTATDPAGPDHPASWFRRLGLLLALAGVLVTIGWFVVRAASEPADPVVPTSAEMEAEWGVRFTEVSVSADGGLVDLRFVVLDADKALSVMSESESAPQLVVDHDGEVSLLPSLMPVHEVIAGRTYFMLYRNTDGVIVPGSTVSITLGDERLDGAVAG